MKKPFKTIEEAYNHVRELGYFSPDEGEIVEEVKTMSDIVEFRVEDRRPNGIYITARIYQGHSNYSILLDVPDKEVTNSEC